MLTPGKMRLAVPAGLVLLMIGFYWKLTLTDEFVWFDHPDMVYIEIPRLQFQAREFQQGHFPLWDPSVWAGQSLIGQTQPGPLFPLNLLFLLLPLRDGYLQAAYLNWYWVILHILAALACYALCRDWGRGYGASVLAAVGFGCGGFLGTVAWLDVAAGAIFTPLVLLFLSRAVEGRRAGASAGLAGMFLGLAWLSGHHEIPLLVSLLFLASWTVAVWLRPVRWRLATVSILIMGLTAALQVIPTVEFGRLSKRWVGTTDPVGWEDRIPYTIPTIYSMPAKGMIQTLLPSADRYADCAPFLGLAVCVMALLGLASAANERRVRWIAVGTVVALLFSLGAGTPLHGVLSSLVPGLGKARIPVRAIHLFNLGLCLLSAYGLDVLANRERANLVRFAALGLTALGAAIFAWAIGGELDDRVILSGALAFLLAAGLVVRFPAVAVRWAWIAVALIEMHGVTTATYSSRFREDQNRFRKLLDQDKDIAAFLRTQELQAPVRLDVNDTDMPMNFGDYHGIDMLGGYLAGLPENLVRAETNTERTKTLLGVTHYLARAPNRPEQALLYAGNSGLKVFRNPEPRPRAWSVHQAIGAATFAELRQRLQADPIQLHAQTVLLGAPPPLESCAGDVIRILSRSSNRVRIGADMRCSGMVILGDAHYPGWEATVDGKPAKIWEAYGFLRGVVVPAGLHQLDFRFRPGSLFAGGVCFVAGLLWTAALLIWGRRD